MLRAANLIEWLMKALLRRASDEEILRFIDRWAELMEREDYAGAFAFTDHTPEMHWSPELIREVVKSYGEGRPDQRVTVAGLPTDITQRKSVSRWDRNWRGEVGQVWYDLNIDGFASDLTATFAIIESPDGLLIRLDDIHVM